MKTSVLSVVALLWISGALRELSSAQLATDPNLQISISRFNQSAVLGWFGSNAMAYQVEASTNLTAWNNVGAALAGNNALLFATIPLSTQSGEFFRVRRMPDTSTAVFNAGTGVLTITGDDLPNIIVVRRDGAGNIRVNDGLLPITGGTPTVVNTTLIQIFGRAGNDVLTLDEVNGALPKANMFGEAGNDTLTGGSGADILNGGVGDDVLLGKGGTDTLLGGEDNDTLTGGDADDQVFGEAGNDRLIWNPGDDTDVMEGGTETDTIEINGGNGAEVFTVTANGTRVRFDRLDPAPFFLDINACENLVLNANGGNDSFSCTGNLAALIQITADGGPGDDTLLGSNGNDLLLGGDNNDFVDGQQGNDTVFLGAGDDVFQWDPGDGNDMVEGQAGNDRLDFNGSNTSEIFDLSANGTRARLTRNIASIVMDFAGIETIQTTALGGADIFTVNDLSATEVTALALRLASTIGGGTGDLQVDSVIINGTALSNSIVVTQVDTNITVAGLIPFVTITAGETNDVLTINGLAGNDTINASGLSSLFAPTLDGGAGDDNIMGSARVDFILGGDENDILTGRQGNDFIYGGNGDDEFIWNPGDGNDTVEGQAGTDQLSFHGSNASEIVDAIAVGGRFQLLRNVASVVLDCDDVEKVLVAATGGADAINIGELTGTDLSDILVDLGSPAGTGTGDAQADTVTLSGSQTNDVITIAGTTSKVTTAGLTAALTIIGMEAATDTLNVNALGGADSVDASGLNANVIKFTVNGGLGGDTLIGSQGDDVITGGDGNDTILAGNGNDTFVWNPGDDNDIFEGQGGVDTLFFNGANVAENIDLSANGDRLRFFRNVASVVTDCSDVETVQFQALGGADVIVVNDLSATDVTSVNLNLAASGGVGDAQPDNVIINGTGNSDSITVAQAGSVVSVSGLATTVNISGSEAANDRVTINTLGGDDVMDASALAAGFISITADGGTDDDTLIGSAGVDTLFGGDGDDVLIGGPGVDVLDGGPGNNLVIPD